MNRLKNCLKWLAIIIVIALLAVNIYTTVAMSQQNQSYFESRIEAANKQINKLKNEVQNIQLQHGYTPVKGVDYFDGKDGLDGKDSTSTHTIEKETIIKEVPIDGEDGEDAYIDLRCNEDKNRWEIKFSPLDSWQILKGTPTKCTLEVAG